MPAKDLYHNVVKNALIKDGWRITHDPLRLKWGIKDMGSPGYWVISETYNHSGKGFRP